MNCTKSSRISIVFLKTKRGDLLRQFQVLEQAIATGGGSILHLQAAGVRNVLQALGPSMEHLRAQVKNALENVSEHAS